MGIIFYQQALREETWAHKLVRDMVRWQAFFVNMDIKFLISEEQGIGLHLYVCELLPARSSSYRCCEVLQFFISDNREVHTAVFCWMLIERVVLGLRTERFLTILLYNIFHHGQRVLS
jgi:hypothetical protein